MLSKVDSVNFLFHFFMDLIGDDVDVELFSADENDSSELLDVGRF